jgi:hypothetical protein
MPEGTPAATILIATTHQAHNRTKEGENRIMLCNCTVVMVFAAYLLKQISVTL